MKSGADCRFQWIFYSFESFDYFLFIYLFFNSINFLSDKFWVYSARRIIFIEFVNLIVLIMY